MQHKQRMPHTPLNAFLCLNTFPRLYPQKKRLLSRF